MREELKLRTWSSQSLPAAKRPERGRMSQRAFSRKTLSAILNGRAGISPDMAVRLSIAFGTSAESWLNQQTQYDLWHAEQRRKRLRVVKLAV
jgi:transcriptional regulator with XRE-family HTH domain